MGHNHILLLVTDLVYVLGLRYFSGSCYGNKDEHLQQLELRKGSERITHSGIAHKQANSSFF